MAIYRTKQIWMATQAYQQLRKRIFANQDHQCLDCGLKRPLELHHLTYRFGGEYYRPDKQGTPWGTETEGDVVGLCRECHKNRHVDAAGNFFGDPEEREVYWATSPAS